MVSGDQYRRLFFLCGEIKFGPCVTSGEFLKKRFFLLSLLGGFMGMHLAMKHFRHKTLHFSFKFIAVISAFLWVIVFPWLYFSFIFQYVKAW